MKLTTRLLSTIAVASALGMVPAIAAGSSAPASSAKHALQPKVATSAPAATTSGPKIDAASGLTPAVSNAIPTPTSGPQLGTSHQMVGSSVRSAPPPHVYPVPRASQAATAPDPASSGHVYRVIPPSQPVSASPSVTAASTAVQTDPLPGQPVDRSIKLTPASSGHVYRVIPPQQPKAQTGTPTPIGTPRQVDPPPQREATP